MVKSHKTNEWRADKAGERPCSIMRRALVLRKLAGAALAGLLEFLQALRQASAQRLQLVDLLLLPIDCLIQGIEQVFLMGDPDFDIDETFFHDGFLWDEAVSRGAGDIFACALPPPCHGQRHASAADVACVVA